MLCEYDLLGELFFMSIFEENVFYFFFFRKLFKKIMNNVVEIWVGVLINCVFVSIIIFLDYFLMVYGLRGFF